MARVARAMAMAIRVPGNVESFGKGGMGDGDIDNGVRQETVMAMKKAMATVTRVAGNKEGDGNNEGTGNSNKGGRQQRGQWGGWQGWW
jgi:hypothetical protein